MLLKRNMLKIEVPNRRRFLLRGIKFLQNLVGRFGDKNAFAELSTSHIARFRLLANSVTKPGNQEMYVGVHDLNLLFSAYIQGMDLGEREKIYLLKWGFIHYGSENVPLVRLQTNGTDVWSC